MGDTMTTIGNYKVGKKLGEGGFGRVYEAEHTQLGTSACVKQNIIADEDCVELLRHEARMLWTLDCFHSIPSVKDFIQTDATTAVLVLSHITGSTLDEIVQAKGPLHPEDACWVTERLLGALHFAHYGGIVHSDVKPENVFVEPAKHDIKLIDFGLASYKPKGTTRPLGLSPKYAAPELFLGQPPIPETDIYGAGIVLLYALGGDVAKRACRSDTPKELVAYVDMLLQYDPMRRPNWEKDDPMQQLSDIREKLFGRRHMGTAKKPGT